MVYIHRELEKTLSKFLKRKEIVAVIGPRQSGKTTLLSHLLSSLNNTYTVSFDDVEALELFEHDINGFVELHIKHHDYVFIDEIQYAKDAGKKLKFIYDKYKTKIFISGSSAPDLSLQSLKYLVGRVFIFHLYPLSFREFLEYKDKRLVSFLQKSLSKPILKKINAFLEEFVMYGGYPEVVLAQTTEEKEVVLKNIYNTYFLREIREILQLTEDYKLSRLIKALSLQVGQIINYNELSEISGFDYSELKKYLNILEKTFICKEGKNFHSNKRQELKKSPKIFFVDNGFRNAVIKNYTKERSDKGSLYENFICSELLKQDFEINYWRTKAKAEVDFVLEKEGCVYPLEVKAVDKISKSFLSFLNTYKPKKGFVTSLEGTGMKKINKTQILFFPLVKATDIDSFLT